VRHDWDASTARGKDSIGLKLTCHVFLALTDMFAPSATSQLRADHTNLLQHVTDSSKSPALLSLLLSCVKQLPAKSTGAAQDGIPVSNGCSYCGPSGHSVYHQQ
jgi:hypothetical protein